MRISDWSSDVCSSDLQYLAIRDRDLLLLSERRWDRTHQLIREIDAHQLDADMARRASLIRHGLADTRLDWPVGTADSESMPESVARIQALEDPIDGFKIHAANHIDQSPAHVTPASTSPRPDQHTRRP